MIVLYCHGVPSRWSYPRSMYCPFLDRFYDDTIPLNPNPVLSTSLANSAIIMGQSIC
jgi:hypothetical protein